MRFTSSVVMPFSIRSQFAFVTPLSGSKAQATPSPPREVATNAISRYLFLLISVPESLGLPNRLRRLLPFRDHRRVRAALHALIEVRLRLFQHLRVLQHLDHAEREGLRRRHHALVADRRTDGG